MANEKEIEMPHAGHDRHMCYLVNLGFHTQHKAPFKKLIKGAQFYCKNCGRAAAHAENLCNPEPLE